MPGKLHVYTGDGKGKTTCAMGLALRCIGHEKPVLVVQFMKDGSSGEITALKSFACVRVETAPAMAKFTFLMTETELAQAAAAHTAFAEALDPGDAFLVVLDELSPAIATGLVDRETACRLIDRMQASAQTVVTGRGAPDWLLARADYISRINAEKHPYVTEGLQAREGIEW